MAEMRAYGEHSFYRNLGKERPSPHGDDEHTANSALSSLSSEESSEEGEDGEEE